MRESERLLVPINSGCLASRSEEWNKVQKKERDKLGLTVANDGEFWYAVHNVMIPHAAGVSRFETIKIEKKKKKCCESFGIYLTSRMELHDWIRWFFEVSICHQVNTKLLSLGNVPQQSTGW